MNNAPILSLCLPTNGVVEWVIPVLDSIFSQKVDSSEFEVILTDNGNNQEFKRIIAEQYVPKYENLVYAETDAPLFLNEIESYKRARGELIKFVNHRTRLVDGAVEKLVRFAKENIQEKPVVYFSNGALPHLKKDRFYFSTFDQFVKNLTYFSSWSTGMTIWKTDFDTIPEGTVFNYLFPHTTILFRERNRSNYIIDNTIVMDEIPVGNKPKGKYDLFYAFAVEYPGILLNLRMDGDISTETFLSVKKDNLFFLTVLYFDFVVRRRYCSYDLSSYGSSIRAFYSPMQINRELVRIVMGKVARKVKKVFGKG